MVVAVVSVTSSIMMKSSYLEVCILVSRRLLRERPLGKEQDVIVVEGTGTSYICDCVTVCDCVCHCVPIAANLIPCLRCLHRTFARASYRLFLVVYLCALCACVSVYVCVSVCVCARLTYIYCPQP